MHIFDFQLETFDVSKSDLKVFPTDLIWNHPNTWLLPLGGWLDVIPGGQNVWVGRFVITRILILQYRYWYTAPGHNVYEEVKLVVFCDCHGNVIPLKSPSLVVLPFSITIMAQWKKRIPPLCESRLSWWARVWTSPQPWQRALEPRQRSSGKFWWGNINKDYNHSLWHPRPISWSSLSWQAAVLGAWGRQWTCFWSLEAKKI